MFWEALCAFPLSSALKKLEEPMSLYGESQVHDLDCRVITMPQDFPQELLIPHLDGMSLHVNIPLFWTFMYKHRALSFTDG